MIAASAQCINAEDVCKYYAEDFAIQKGETKTVSIYLDNPNYSFTAFQCDIYFKGGLAPALDDWGDPVFEAATRITKNVKNMVMEGAFMTDDNGEEYFRLLAYNMKGMYVGGNSGVLFTLDVTTNDAFGTSAEAPSIVFKGKELKISDIATAGEGAKLCEGSTNEVFEAIPLADFNKATNGKTYYIADPIKVVAKTSQEVEGKTLAFATDGKGNWLKLALNADENAKYLEGVTYAGDQIGGVVEGSKFNPATAVVRDFGNEVATHAISTDMTLVDMTQPLSLQANEVISVAGYFYNGELRAYMGGANGQGQSLTVKNDWTTAADMTNATPYNITKAAVQLKAAWDTTDAALIAPSDDLAFQNYVIYPLKAAEIATAVDDVNASKGISSVRYYNVAGVEAATPFQGMNLVVTTYNDGTTSTAKVIK